MDVEEQGSTMSVWNPHVVWQMKVKNPLYPHLATEAA